MSDERDVGAAAIRAAAAQVSSRLTPGHGPPLLRHLALLAEVDPGPAPHTWTDAHARMLSAIVVARARTDALGEGIALIERYFEDGRLRRPSSLSASARADLFASVAEYLCNVGWPPLAARYAEESALFATTPGERYRALSAVAQTLSLNGEFPQAEDAVTAARALFRREGWAKEDASLWLLYADGLVAMNRADPARLREVARELDDSRPDDPFWRFAAGLGRVTAGWLEGQYDLALAKGRQLLHGAGRSRSHRHMRERLVGMCGGLLAMQGDLDGALRVLGDQASSAGHAICFESQRASVLLGMGRDQELIDITDGCVTMVDHCLFALPALLIRRAVSLLRLGQEARAVSNLASSLALVERTGSQMSFFLLLAADIERLLDLVEADRPDLASAASAARSALPRELLRSMSPPAVPPGGNLTPAERELSTLLVTGRPLAQIAQARGVSVNTVKSQVRSIHAKLGVSNRAELVRKLRRTGE